MVIPLLDTIAIQGKTITVDALLTQRKFADYVVSREVDNSHGILDVIGVTAYRHSRFIIVYAQLAE